MVIYKCGIKVLKVSKFHEMKRPEIPRRYNWQKELVYSLNQPVQSEEEWSGLFIYKCDVEDLKTFSKFHQVKKPENPRRYIWQKNCSTVWTHRFNLNGSNLTCSVINATSNYWNSQNVNKLWSLKFYIASKTWMSIYLRNSFCQNLQ